MSGLLELCSTSEKACEWFPHQSTWRQLHCSPSCPREECELMMGLMFSLFLKRLQWCFRSQRREGGGGGLQCPQPWLPRQHSQAQQELAQQQGSHCGPPAGHRELTCLQIQDGIPAAHLQVRAKHRPARVWYVRRPGMRAPGESQVLGSFEGSWVWV